MIADISNIWLRVAVDELSAITTLIAHCDNLTLRETTTSVKAEAVFRWDKLLQTTLVGDAVLYITATTVRVWKLRIEFAHMAAKFLLSVNPQFQLMLEAVNLSIIGDTKDFKELYEIGIDIMGKHMVTLQPTPKTCKVVINSANSAAIAISLKHTPLEHLDVIANSEKSTVYQHFSEYTLIVDEVSLYAIQDYCREIGTQLKQELDGFESLRESPFLDFLADMDFVPSRALADFNRGMTRLGRMARANSADNNGEPITGAHKLISFLQSYYPTLNFYQALAGTHTILLDEHDAIVTLPLIDMGYDFENYEITSLDLMDHIPQLDYDDLMEVNLHDMGMPIRKLMLSGLYCRKFPHIHSDELEELVLRDTLICELDYDVQSSLPNLKRVYIESQTSLQPFFADWVLYTEKVGESLDNST